MNLDNFDDRLNLLENLRCRSGDLADSFIETEKVDVLNDRKKMLSFHESIFTLRYLMEAERHLILTYDEMSAMKANVDDDKFLIVVEKNLNKFVKNVFIKNIETILDCSKNWTFIDHRAKKFQEEIIRELKKLKDWYKKNYSL